MTTHVLYDDGDMRWHNLDDASGGCKWRETRRFEGQAPAAAAARPKTKKRSLEIGASTAKRRPEV